MKTLDEVIIALEVCTSGYCSHPKHGDCPYLDERNDCDTRQRKLDALQWLKGYKAHIELDRLRDKCEAKNDPLTWDELRTMDGKPVWVENQFYKRWLIAYKVNREDIIFDGNGFYTQAFSADYGKAWQAYRKERTNDN